MIESLAPALLQALVGEPVIVTDPRCVNYTGRTRIVEVRESSGGGILYVMANGQWLDARQFRVTI